MWVLRPRRRPEPRGAGLLGRRQVGRQVGHRGPRSGAPGEVPRAAADHVHRSSCAGWARSAPELLTRPPRATSQRRQPRLALPVGSQVQEARRGRRALLLVLLVRKRKRPELPRHGTCLITTAATRHLPWHGTCLISAAATRHLPRHGTCLISAAATCHLRRRGPRAPAGPGTSSSSPLAHARGARLPASSVTPAPPARAQAPQGAARGFIRYVQQRHQQDAPAAAAG
jgi:hypothetical protein